jgi:hypothetical protein
MVANHDVKGANDRKSCNITNCVLCATGFAALGCHTLCTNAKRRTAVFDRGLAGKDGELLKMQLHHGILPLGIVITSA